MRPLGFLIIFYVVGYHRVQNYSLNYLIASYANASVAMANYFSSGCIYLLSHSELEDKSYLVKIAKYISHVHGKLNTATTISNYFVQLNKTSDLDLCYNPLHVIIDDHDGNQLVREEISLYSGDINGADQQDGGMWLIFLKHFDPYSIDKYFRIMDVPFDVEMIVAWIDNKQIHFKEVYRVAPTFPLRQPYLGNWSLQTGLNCPNNPAPHSRRDDLEGLELRVGYANIPPMAIEEQYENKIRVGGFVGEIWRLIESAMNASSRFVKSNELGSKSNSTWSGLLGELKNNNIDVAVSPFILTRDRVDIVEFGFPLVETKFQVFFQLPGSSADLDGFLLPFGTDVWLATGASLIIGSLLLYIIGRISNQYLDTDEYFTLSSSVFTYFVALCGQGAEKEPTRLSSRIIFFLPFILTTILIPAYSASLTSYLSVMEPEIPFRNMKEFYENKMYKMLVRSGSYEYDWFEAGSSSNPYIHKIYQRDMSSKEKLPKTNKEALEMLCQNKYLAFFGIEASVEWHLENSEVEREKLGCTITKMERDQGRISIGMGLPLNSHYKGIINNQIRNLQSIGIDERIRRKYWAEFTHKLHESWKPVRIDSVSLIFALLVIGLIMASLIFIAEFFLSHRSNVILPVTQNDISSRSDMDRNVVIHRSLLY